MLREKLYYTMIINDQKTYKNTLKFELKLGFTMNLRKYWYIYLKFLPVFNFKFLKTTLYKNFNMDL